MKIQRLNDILTPQIREVIFPYAPIEIFLGKNDEVVCSASHQRIMYATLVIGTDNAHLYRFEFAAEMAAALAGYFDRSGGKMSQMSFFLSRDVDGSTRITYGRYNIGHLDEAIKTGSALDQLLPEYYSEQVGKKL